MNKNKNKGFTLIELLVVMAIIGILASVVLLSLTSAKRKSNDTAVKSGLNQARIQADMFYNYSGIYTGLCDVSKNSADPKGINAMIYASGKTNGYTKQVTVNGVGASPVRCNASANGWAAEAPLKNETGYYCVDYTKKGIVTTTSVGGTYAYCR